MRIVIKFAGALLEDAALVRELSKQVATLARHGHDILVVHGGGRLFTATLKRMGIESKFVSGLRVTDAETRDAAVMVFGGLLNKRLAGAITSEGQPAVGISASDAACFCASPLVHNDVEGSLGFVGYLTSVNVRFLESLWREKLLPVAACLGLGADGELYNINADHMAAACAEFIEADHLVYRRSRCVGWRKSSLRYFLRTNRYLGAIAGSFRRYGVKTRSGQARSSRRR
jgi:acetylglutamate kinase